MYFDESIQEWRYSDDDTLVMDHRQERPCAKCGEQRTDEGHDPCLGTLPGVLNACCGHGHRVEAYIQFKNGVCIRGFDPIEPEAQEGKP